MIDKTRYPPGGASAEAVQEIRRIKARVDAERLPRGADPNTHTKLGRGGLADIEWTVQLLQLRHAHKVPALHSTSTLDTLNAIGAAELIAEGDIELLRQAWLTATRARNALVLVRGKPTDQLPGPGRQLNAVALAAGWDSDDGGEFLDNYLRVTRRAKAVVRKVLAGEAQRMSMDFGVDVISAEEYDRQRALYGPLTEALRKLIAAGDAHRGRRGDRPISTGDDRVGDRDAPAQTTHHVVDVAPCRHGPPAGVGQSRCRASQCDRTADGDPSLRRRSMLERVHPQHRVRGSTGLGARRHLCAGARPHPRRGGQRWADPAEVHRHDHASVRARHAAGAAARGGVRRAHRGRQDLCARAISTTRTARPSRPKGSSFNRHGRATSGSELRSAAAIGLRQREVDQVRADDVVDARVAVPRRGVAERGA